MPLTAPRHTPFHASLQLRRHNGSHQTILIGRRSIHTCVAHIFALIFNLTHNLDFQSPTNYGHDPHTSKNKGRRSVGLKDGVETDDGRTRPIALLYPLRRSVRLGHWIARAADVQCGPRVIHITANTDGFTTSDWCDS